MAGRHGRKYVKDEEFEEEEVWGVMEENSSPKLRKLPLKSSSATKHFTAVTGGNNSAARMIPRSSTSSSSLLSSPSSCGKQSSAPMDIPDWSKIYGKKNNGASSWVDYNNAVVTTHDVYYGHGCHGHVNHGDGSDEDEDGDKDDDDDDNMVPPHEYLAKRLARSKISSFSVYEGIGRTLKGRDLCKVRNSILTKTGFLE
ncbi:hypothetical protein SOVF_141420 [Spinacia oleracea]|uniref:Protein S40-6 n=1 Tax=Spinacia oleracea TaxID=3562 RepID=A0A9R0HVU2_SPIOL|nr:protein S40-6-like [Spinacia oleracea]XP_021837766.2 protein S40-6-like [Spinacia oleracea]XP_021837768.2 protein S40-6-like [Spinacia oleracea]XP_056689056.1 protein S40-6-like [Spinacia oleracea]KNA10757.1 hypothetical protein SOVF_141420 [Spinacia oleracea]